MLHTRFSLRILHVSEACGVACRERVCCCRPPLHDFVHRVHTPNAVYGHEHVPSWHGRCCTDTEEVGALPPHRGCVILRVRVFCPPLPHVLLHALHALHELTMPSTGQQFWLHLRVSAECGHATPPKRGCTVGRERACKPPPQLFVHVVQAVPAFTNDSTLQSTGQ